MGCRQSVPVAEVAVGTETKSREAAALLENDEGSSLDVISSNPSEGTFEKDYRIVRRAGGSLSRIYMVTKNHPAQHAGQQQSSATTSNEDLDVYVMQVIDMKSVAPERREAIKDEIQSLKKLRHPNSKFSRRTGLPTTLVLHHQLSL